MAHHMNFVKQSSFSMPMVSKLEDLLQLFYGYFYSSSKHHLEIQNLVEIIEIKGLKVL
jgi:hypothetical protein